jgi:hypothetical protein
MESHGEAWRVMERHRESWERHGEPWTVAERCGESWKVMESDEE